MEWPPRTPMKTFRVLQRKLAEFRGEGMPKEQQLAVIDLWMGMLYTMRSYVGGGNTLGPEAR